jgi:hypothetical protein
MKRVCIILLLTVLVSITSASVELNNYTFQNSYGAYEPISGEINITIIGEDYSSILRSSDGETIALSKFLTDNGALYECSPQDCSIGYSTSDPSTSKTFSISSEKSYGGFTLYGTDVSVSAIDFSISSDFSAGTDSPLAINYFESGIWTFQEFLDEFSSKNWGCYNSENAEYGAYVGTSSYCELITISETNAIKSGASVDNGDNQDITMSLYSENGNIFLGSCDYNPITTFEGCQIDAEFETVFETGDYQVCASADTRTDFKILQETDNDNCGFTYGSNPENSVRDYAIFAQSAKHAGASALSSSNFNLPKIAEAADEIILNRYNRDCTNGCPLPIEFSGIPQNLQISNAKLDYVANGENLEEPNIYDLERIPSFVDFSGILDLELTNFRVSKTGNYSIYFENTKLFNETVTKSPIPMIRSLSPLNPPAGAPISFYLDVSYPVENASLSYAWTFGNYTTRTTTNSLVHTFDEIKSYNVNITIDAGQGALVSKGFVINAISPAEAINASIQQKNSVLDDVLEKINLVPQWYRNALLNSIDFSFYRDELKRIKQLSNNTNESSDLIDIAKDLYALNMPSDLSSEKTTNPYFSVTIEDIQPEKILTITEESLNRSANLYRNAILGWQTTNIRGSFIEKKYFVIKENGNKLPLLNLYEFSINSTKDEDSHFVINRDGTDLHFESTSGIQNIANSVAIEIGAGASKSFKFYQKDTNPLSFFVSPRLSTLALPEDFDGTCNYNDICEEDLEENPDSCRNDCKPVGSATLLYVLLFLFIIILYTALQFWYKTKYEKWLFKDKKHLYNLLMYIANARAREQGDGAIIAALRKRGWSGEKLNYVIKKSKGQRVGLPEIIPIDRFAAYSRKKKAEAKVKTQKPATNIATANQQQIGRNINKSKVQTKIEANRKNIRDDKNN